MDYRGDQRPPRSARPPGPPSYPNSADSAPQSPDVPFPPTRPPIHPSQASTFSNQTHQTKGTISFQDQERGDRHGHVGRNSLMPVAWAGDPEAGADVGRKKSLVRPDREKIEPGHRQWHYRTHAAQLEDENAGRVGVLPSGEFNIICPLISYSSHVLKLRAMPPILVAPPRTCAVASPSSVEKKTSTNRGWPCSSVALFAA